VDILRVLFSTSVISKQVLSLLCLLFIDFQFTNKLELSKSEPFDSFTRFLKNIDIVCFSLSHIFIDLHLV